MENELLHVINYPAVISKNCIKVKLEALNVICKFCGKTYITLIYSYLYENIVRNK